jgi:Fe-Mn family superoxide dismutase
MMPAVFATSVPPLQVEGTAGVFELPSLPYPADALEPHIDAQTMQIHHGKHHATYVKNLIEALSKVPEWKTKSLEDLLRNLNNLPEAIRTAVRNNGGGHFNHSMFWESLAKDGGGQPTGELAKAMDAKFGSFSQFQQEFTKTAATLFGSGWVWLSLSPTKEILIESTPNQDSPLMKVCQPLLGLDIWEHAYYLKYQNRRAEYIQAFYKIIHWNAVSERYKTAMRP